MRGRLTKADCNITFLSEKFSHSFPVVRIIFLLCESNISSVAWILFLLWVSNISPVAWIIFLLCASNISPVAWMIFLLCASVHS